jgi:hypothetical protein
MATGSHGTASISRTQRKATGGKPSRSMHISNHPVSSLSYAFSKSRNSKQPGTDSDWQ